MIKLTDHNDCSIYIFRAHICAITPVSGDGGYAGQSWIYLHTHQLLVKESVEIIVKLLTEPVYVALGVSI